jgi:hypothetical protein
VIVRETVINIVPTAGGLDQPRLSEHLKMLRGIRNRLIGLFRESLYGTLPLRKQFNQFQTPPACHRFRKAGELIVKLVLEPPLLKIAHTPIQPNT